MAGGRPAYLLDGENVRHGLSGDLGFSAADRHEHARRVASVARMLADAGLVTVVALVSPAAADRERARQLHDEAGLDFVEAWVDTPVEECERRDPHGLYARARAGTLSGFTGVDAPYEPPETPTSACAAPRRRSSSRSARASDARGARPRPPRRRLTPARSGRRSAAAAAARRSAARSPASARGPAPSPAAPAGSAAAGRAARQTGTIT